MTGRPGAAPGAIAPQGAPRPFALRAYTLAARLVAPLAFRRIAERLRAQGVPEPRIRERRGQASLPRPAGRLFWFHAASVGESLSVLPLLDALLARDPALSVLVTTGTASSAEILARRLPPRCLHQFAPLDTSAALRRFLGHWRPDLAVLVESELWPQMLTETKARGLPMVLLNARLSDRSLRRWRRFGATAAHLLGMLDLIVAQTPQTARNLAALGVAPGRIEVGGDMKAAAGAPPHDPAALQALRAALAGRPVWVASSTHPGEEEIVLEAHTRARDRLSDLLLILVPRHPARGDVVARLVEGRGLALARRSRGDEPGPASAVYLADTLGETGLWYALSPLVFLGGSLVPVGGHNPFEAAAAGAALLHGPLVPNAAPAYAAMGQAGGARAVTDAAGLAGAVAALLSDPPALAAMRAAARGVAEAGARSLDPLAEQLFALAGGAPFAADPAAPGPGPAEPRPSEPASSDDERPA